MKELTPFAVVALVDSRERPASFKNKHLLNKNMGNRYLFRGKRIDNGEFVFGCLNILGKSAYIADSNRNWFEVIPETAGQFTGLTDKNGVKIFEGDKIKGGVPVLDDMAR